MQKVGDASLRGANVFDWTKKTVEEIRKHTARKIIVRPHPLYRKLKISRIALRDLGLAGLIPGMTKSSW